MIDNLETRNSDLASATGPFVIAVQSADIPIILVNVLGNSNSVAIANAKFFEMTGLSPAVVLGQSVATAFAAMVDPSEIETIEARLGAGQPSTWELTLEPPDGSGYRVTALLHPLREHAGVQRQHVMSFYPSDRSGDRPRGVLMASLELYKHAPGFIATSEGPDHRITFANDSYIRFVGRRRLEGLTVAEAMPEVAAQGFVAILDRVFQTGVPYRGDTVPFDLADPQGGQLIRRYADFVYEPVRDADSNIVGIFCEGYDVTEQQEAESALRTLQSALAHSSRVNAMGTMATTLAHELNQPLSAISNYASGALRLLDAGAKNAGAVEQALTSIELAAQRAGAIIRVLRDIADRRVRASEIFDLQAVVDESIDLTRSACSPATEIVSNIPAKLTLHADRIQVQQVVINLLRNGCDAVARTATQKVTISAEAAADEVIVSVHDTGPGVTTEAAESMFTWSNTTKEGGMGLGLSISRTIIEAHGGRIWLENSSDAGSLFRFALPTKPFNVDETLGG